MDRLAIGRTLSEHLAEHEPSVYAAYLFGSVARGAMLDVALEAAAGFRNIVVHGYGEVDLRVLRDVAENRLDDLLLYATVIRTRLPG